MKAVASHCTPKGVCQLFGGESKNGLIRKSKRLQFSKCLWVQAHKAVNKMRYNSDIVSSLNFL